MEALLREHIMEVRGHSPTIHGFLQSADGRILHVYLYLIVRNKIELPPTICNIDIDSNEII